jgi:hypothetical protein
MVSVPPGALRVLLLDAAGQVDDVLVLDILREHVGDHLRPEVADPFQFGEEFQNLLGREGGDDRTGLIVHPRSDRAAGVEDGEGGHVGVEDRLLVLVDPYVLASLLHLDPFGTVDPDTHVVSIGQLQDDVMFISTLGARHHDAVVGTLTTVEDDVIADIDLVLLQQPLRDTLVGHRRILTSGSQLFRPVFRMGDLPRFPPGPSGAV